MNRSAFHGRLVILLLVAATVLLAGCARKPLIAVSRGAAPIFIDDLDTASLKKAIRANLDYLEQQPPGKTFPFADGTIPASRLRNSLEHFLEILAAAPSPGQLNRLIKERFDIYQATGVKGFNPGRKMLITGYFQPIIAGSLTREPPYIYPLYRVPADLHRGADTGNGIAFGRMVNGKMVPYWTRKEIETGNRAAGSELVWLKDPFDAFVLHIQGSGLIRLRDGSVRGVHYAAKNGQPYRSIGKHLVDTGRIPLAMASMDTIRAYIAGHPEERDEILHHNPSFIFFDWTATHGALGNLGKELTAGRSIAVDQSCFPPGGLAFLVSRKPAAADGSGVTWSRLQRFVLVQDTGSAIRGPGRVDLFWGTGAEAGWAAGRIKEKGTMYFLLLKEDQPAAARLAGT